MRRFMSMLTVAPLALFAATAYAKPPLADAAPKTMAEATAGSSNVSVWTVGDDDTTVYMMGTVHILVPDIEWKNDAVEAAWNESASVYFEADVTSPEATSQVASLITQVGINAPGVTLASFYTDEEQATIREHLASLDLTLEMLNPLRPWLAGLQVGVIAIQKAGGQQEAGVEVILGAEADAQGKEKRYFETVDQQVRMLAGIDDKEQAQVFLSGMEDLTNPEAYFAALVGAWYTGEDDVLAELMSEGFDSAPNVAQVLLFDRNKAWASELDTLIKEEPGVFFVAVGAGHLVGEKSVQDYLAELGHEASRVN